MSKNNAFNLILNQIINDGVKTIKVLLNGALNAKIYIEKSGAWVYYATVEQVTVISLLQNATKNQFCTSKLIDRQKIPSEALGHSIGSAVLRFSPACQPNAQAQVLLSGLRTLS